MANANRSAQTPARFGIALVQFAPVKGDLDANFAQVADALQALVRSKQPLPGVVAFPETCLSGYFVEGGVRDVALPASRVFAKLNEIAQKTLPRAAKQVDVVLGFYETAGGKLYNSALYATLGREPVLRHVHRKLFLATYGVFDEERFVSRGRGIDVFKTSHGQAAILICEDAVHSLSTIVAALKGAQTVYVPSASPGRGMEDAEPANVRMWREILRVAAAEHGMFFAYAGLVGFEGGKGFTGASKLVGPFGDVRAEAPFLGPAILRATVNLEDVTVARAALPTLGDLEANLAELVGELQPNSRASSKPKARARRR